MKKQTIPVVLFALLSLAAMSCQKEHSINPVTDGTEQIAEGYNYRYTVNGKAYYANVSSESERQQLFELLMDEARRGNTVSIRRLNISIQTAPTKEKVTFTTSNKGEALAWAKDMTEQGYDH